MEYLSGGIVKCRQSTSQAIKDWFTTAQLIYWQANFRNHELSFTWKIDCCHQYQPEYRRRLKGLAFWL